MTDGIGVPKVVAMNDNDLRDALADRLFEAAVGTLELFSVYLGWRLGLYRTLADNGPLTAPELAAAAGIDGRYAREWLEQQAVAGFLEMAGDSRFTLAPAHAEVLVDPESPAHAAPFAPMVVGIGAALSRVADAYRTGRGVPYSDYGADFRDGQGAINRPAYVHELAGWLEAVPEVRSERARVADLGCGQGWSTLALAAAFPSAVVDGFDADEASILDAKVNAAAHPAGERVSFVCGDAATVAAAGPYDVLCFFEALHDLSDPVGALAAAGAALAPGGAVVVVDERVADAFAAPGDLVERMMYGWSVSHCLPAARAEEPSAALGTVLRSGTVRHLAEAAGLPRVEIPEIESAFFRMYVLRP